MTHQENNTNGWDVLKSSVGPSLAIAAMNVSIISSWVYFKFPRGDHEVRIKALESRQDEQSSQWAQVQANISGINAKMDIVLKKLNY